jgi:trk system potassium uptake protein TrkH
MKYITKRDLMTISHFLGLIMEGIGITVLIPVIVALIYHEYEIWTFLIPGAFSIALGYFFKKSNKIGELKLKHGMIISTLAWLWASIIGALIMVLALDISFIDGLFENMSAWTGAGITIIPNLEIIPNSILFLRSLEQWVGGLGIIALITGILLHSGTPIARLYNSEARQEKIAPSVGSTLKKIIKIYGTFTVLGIVLFILAGMPIFDSINHSLTAISTGGMSIKNASFGYYNNNTYNIIAMFLMIIGATSFLTIYKSFTTKHLNILKDTQFQVMIVLIVLIFGIILFYTDLLPMEIIFHIVSAITTTGFTLHNQLTISLWPEFMKFGIFALMLIGGSSGSTSGGLKIIRFVLLFKDLHKTVLNIISPEGRIIRTRINSQNFSEHNLKEANSYFALYMIFIFIGWGVFIAHGFDPLRALFDVVSAQGNVGINTGLIFSGVPISAKIMLIINMWIGRLEIIPLLVFLTAIIEFFKKNKAQKKSKLRKIKFKDE